VLGGLGLNISPAQSVILAGLIAFAYLVVSGVRSPAFVSILKDTFMMVGIVVVGVAAFAAAGSFDNTFNAPDVPPGMTTLAGSDLTFTLTTIAFQSVVFYLGFSVAFVFTANSERALKSSTVWMPVYMLMYPFLFVASFYALAHADIDNPNSAFMSVTTGLLPDWLVGVVAAGAGLSGILVLAVTALTIGGVVTRNLVPHVKAESQKRISNVVVAAFLIIAALLTLQGSELMLTLLTLFYYLLGQMVPAWLAVMFFPRAQGWAVTAGIVVGVAASFLLYFTEPSLWGINPGLVAALANVAVVVIGSLASPGVERIPMARWRSGDVEPAHDSKPDAAVVE
jgi:solute:Na+ symporter, SSS family